MREIDARVTGFDYTSFHAYTTEVEVDGCAWTLAIRYNTFYQFYTRLTALEKHFSVDFPPKGGLFFSPPPEERQEQLDDFLLSTLAYFDMRGHPKRMEALLGELLQIPEHLHLKDDEERTASEGSSVAEELLLDTPMPGHDDALDDFLESDDDHDGGKGQDVEVDNQVEVERDDQAEQRAPVKETEETEVAVPGELETKREVAGAELEEKPEATEAQPEEKVEDVEAEPEKPEAAEVEIEEKEELSEPQASPKSDEGAKVTPVQQMPDNDLTGGAVAKDYIAMLRRKTLVDGAIQAAVVSTMKENVEKSKAAKVEKAAEKPEPAKVVKEVEPTETKTPIPEVVTPKQEEQPAAEEETTTAVPVETTTSEPTTVAVSEAPKAVPEEEAVEALEPEGVSSPAESPSEADFEETPVTEAESVLASVSETEAVAECDAPASEDADQEDESSSESEEEEAAPEPSKKEAESENPVVSWFRRMGTFGPSPAEKEEHEALAAKKEQEEQEAAARAEAEAKAEAEAAEAEARAKAEAEAEARAEAAEAELLRAEQEMNQRLQRYRHPVFFQGFNCDVGTSRYSLPQRLSDGIIV
ncbi:unnamed protein product [Phytophthora lilii]|uniref:Unnamed protein product n=1 Tax=Phytophthora lilii TaxID=2077276 RepID=A0A9W6WFQ8_9STRA|nr:unnamed protein product [Phytophthora lilii]